MALPPCWVVFQWRSPFTQTFVGYTNPLLVKICSLSPRTPSPPPSLLCIVEHRNIEGCMRR
ncbi:unnamed protein product [Laminaria digitata]